MGVINETSNTVTGTTSMAIRETASVAVAAQADAAVKARYAMAVARPRNMDLARTKLMAECKRTGFAETAIYSKPVGGGKTARGPSIRFAEAAARALGNILPEAMSLFDDDGKRIVRLSVTDLEANVTWSRDIVIEKTVERSNSKGREILGTRTNTSGAPVYLVRATEDELATKEAAEMSKVLRTLLLRLVPDDIVEDCARQIKDTLSSDATKDPAQARKRLVDAFADVGVYADQLAAYIGHDLAALQPAELQSLREIHSAIKDGQARWSDYWYDGGKVVDAPVKPTIAESAAKAEKPAPKKKAEAPADDGVSIVLGLADTCKRLGLDYKTPTAGVDWAHLNKLSADKIASLVYILGELIDGATADGVRP